MDLFSLHTYSDVVLLILRVVVGVIFIVHGRMKWGLWEGKRPEQMPPSLFYIFRLLAICEPVGGLAMIAGFLTQVVAICFGIVMLGALNSKFRKVPFSAHDRTGWELDLLMLAACFVILFLGAGMYSLDHQFFVVG